MTNNWLFYFLASISGFILGKIAYTFAYQWANEIPLSGVPFKYLLKPKVSHNNAKCRFSPTESLVYVSCILWALSTGVVFGFGLTWFLYTLLGTLLITSSIADILVMQLPDRITYLGTALALGSSFVVPNNNWTNSILGALVGSILFWLIQAAYRQIKKQEGLGTGDVKYMLMIGAIVGLSNLPSTIILSSVLAIITHLIINFFSKSSIQKRIPYAPFLSLGAMGHVLWGQIFTF